MTATNSDAPKLKRRRFQFSLRTLLVVMLLATLPMAWFGNQVEQRAAEELFKLGGDIDYSVPGEERSVPFQAGTKLPWRGHVESVELVNHNKDVAGMVHLKKLKHLQILVLGGSPISHSGPWALESGGRIKLKFSRSKISDADVAHLQGLTQLQWLFLSGTQISDAGLIHLQGMTQLQILRLDHTQIGGAGLIHFKEFKQLQTLTLHDTQIGGAGLIHLQGLAQLRELYLSNTKVSDAGLVHLQGITQLRSLSLNNTQISDAGLIHLKGLTQLQSLSLDDTQISDAGLVHLKELTQLPGLQLHNTQISYAGMAELQKALPKCQISYSIRNPLPADVRAK